MQITIKEAIQLYQQTTLKPLSLNIKETELEEESDLTTLLELIQQTFLVKLSLSNISLNDLTNLSLIDYFKTNHLTQLSLSQIRTQSMSDILSTIFTFCDSLTKFSCQFCDITPEIIAEVLPSLKENKTLTSLNFSCNPLRFAGVNYLAEVISISTNTAIKHLFLDRVELENKNVDMNVGTFLKTLEPNTTLEQISFINSQISVNLIALFHQYLVTHPNLVKFSIQTQKPGLISNLLSKNLTGNLRLTELRLPGNVISNKDLEDLTDYLYTIPPLQTLNLYACSLSISAIEKLAESISPLSNLTYLDLSNTNTSKKALIPIWQLINKGVGLKTLLLKGMFTDIETTHLLMDVLKNSPPLETLILEKIEYDTEAIKKLNEVLTQNTSLTHFEYQSYGFDQKSIISILENLTSNHTLKKFSLDFFNLDENIIDWVVQLLKNNDTLSYLTLSFKSTLAIQEVFEKLLNALKENYGIKSLKFNLMSAYVCLEAKNLVLWEELLSINSRLTAINIFNIKKHEDIASIRSTLIKNKWRSQINKANRKKKSAGSNKCISQTEDQSKAVTEFFNFPATNESVDSDQQDNFLINKP